MVRARLLSEAAPALKISALSRTDGAWAFSICSECAKHAGSNQRDEQ
jgi:hypothetical protein